MPHPAINLNAYISNGQIDTYNQLNGGPWVYQGTAYNRRWKGVKMIRPASTKNLRRPDNTRPPSSWVASGGTCESPLSAFAEIQVNGTTNIRYQGAYTPFWILGNNLGNPNWIDPNLKVATMQKALKKVTSRSVQLNTALREAGRTARMVGDAATGLAHGIDRVLQKMSPAPARTWKKLPGKYLEYLYGWRPVSQDVSDSFLELASLRDEGYAYAMTIRAQSILRGKQEQLTNGMVSSAMARDYADLMQIERCGLTFSFPDWYQESLPVISPFGNLWEQTPYSFIADWFLPIGDWVASMESMQLAPFFKEGFQSSLIKRQFRNSRFSQADNAFLFRSTSQLPVRGSDYWYERSVVHSLAEVAFRLPSLRNPLSLDHAAQGLALLTQVLKKWW